MYLSAGAAAYATAEDDVWRPGVAEPADHPPMGMLHVLHFKDGLVAGWDLWWAAATLETWRVGVFAPGRGGSQQLRDMADRYLAAWASGDTARIAALYHEDASFSDTMRGLQAQGPAAIAELSDTRFGSAGTATFEVIDLYAQTNTPYVPIEVLPDRGAITAVGIHNRYTLVVDGRPAPVESLTTFELGTRQAQSFALDPNGLITREEVFYDADNLLASGLVR